VNGLGFAADALRSMEDRWFDVTRSVKTSRSALTLDAAATVGPIRDSLPYIPVRIGAARTALRALPIRDPARYTFIDVGSGEGLVLFLAAERPFRRIRGLEFVVALHERACANLVTYRRRFARCRDIASINIDAAAFEFPAEDLIIYLFNPFGPAVFAAVLSNLQRSVAGHQGHVVVIVQWPVLGHMVARLPGFRAHTVTSRFHIYERPAG
jgi:hypothetical protein